MVSPTNIYKNSGTYIESPYLTVQTNLWKTNTPGNFYDGTNQTNSKKGDCTKIGNWRPINLLSNFYKIVSRMINNRLKEVANRILSRAQKGFNKKRYIQESILNVMETMDFCTQKN